jgi:hypothetical protein
MIMDQDGANPFFLTSADAMVLTPRFSPSTQLITYMSFETGAPRVFLYNLETNRREVLGDFPGMTFSPRLSRWRRRLHADMNSIPGSAWDLRTRRGAATNHPRSTPALFSRWRRSRSTRWQPADLPDERRRRAPWLSAGRYSTPVVAARSSRSRAKEVELRDRRDASGWVGERILTEAIWTGPTCRRTDA